MHFISMFYKLQTIWLFKIDLVYVFALYLKPGCAAVVHSARPDGSWPSHDSNMMWIKFS